MCEKTVVAQCQPRSCQKRQAQKSNQSLINKALPVIAKVPFPSFCSFYVLIISPALQHAVSNQDTKKHRIHIKF